MRESSGREALVLGVGNPDRADDGCGREAARRLRPRLGERALVEEARGDPTRLLDLWDGRPLVIVIDAVRSGRPAGTVRRIEVVESTPIATIGGTSTHGLSLGESIGLGRALHRLPDRLVIYGIEIASLEAGTGFSSPVQTAIGEVVDRVETELGSSRGSGDDDA